MVFSDFYAFILKFVLEKYESEFFSINSKKDIRIWSGFVKSSLYYLLIKWKRSRSVNKNVNPVIL